MLLEKLATTISSGKSYLCLNNIFVTWSNFW